MLAVVPRTARPVVVVAAVATEAALAVRALDHDAFLVVAAGLVTALLAIVVREVLSTFSLLVSPSSERRRERERARREQERERADWERERRREQREARRTRERDRLAA